MNRFLIRCAVHGFIFKDNKILLYRRANTDWKNGKYGVPAGHLEPQESLKEAVIREIKEESGLTVKEHDLNLVHISHRVFNPKKSVETNKDYIDIFFEVTKFTGEPYVTEENKSDDMIWANINNLPKETLEYIKSAIENYTLGNIYSEFSK
jgi:8-oxo-dGTP diphosphatase